MSKDRSFRILLDECASFARIPSSTESGTSSNRRFVSNALTLLEQDNSVPFIARYRQDQTGNIAVEDLYEIQRRWSEFLSVIKLRNSRLAILEANGKCTEEVKNAFFECIAKDELDDLYSTLKETKTAKSEVISAFGLEETAESLLVGKVKHVDITKELADIAHSNKYSISEALIYICTSKLTADLEVKTAAKDIFMRHSTQLSTTLSTAYKALVEANNKSSSSSKPSKPTSTGKTVGTAGQSEAKMSEFHKYKDYHNLQHRRVLHLSSHQVLALRRAKDAGVIAMTLSADDIAKEKILRLLSSRLHCQAMLSLTAATPSNNAKAERVGGRILRDDVLSGAAKEVVSRLCASLTKKQWKDAINRAEIDAASVFSTSLRPLLLSAPLRKVLFQQEGAFQSTTAGGGGTCGSSEVIVCAVDPGFAHGHKWVILSQRVGGPTTAPAAGTSSSSHKVSADGTILCYGKIFDRGGNAGGGHSHSHGHSSSDGGNNIKPRSSYISPVILHSSDPVQFAALLAHYHVNVVAIGNGTASREAQALVAAALSHLNKTAQQSDKSNRSHERSSEAVNKVEVEEEGESKKRRREKESMSSSSSSSSSNNTASASASSTTCGYVVVSEAGASVYSASELARQEFPPDVLEISFLGAVSIGRRLIDPLSELVKVQVIYYLIFHLFFCFA
jgi:transcriptional accessory protein Tex/SPT6